MRAKAAAGAAVLGLVLAGVGLASGGVAATAVGGGSPLLQESFTTGSVLSDQYRVGGTGGNAACLTATGSPVGQVPESCGIAAGSTGGALRLTPASGGQTGYLLYNHPLPTKAGLQIEFNMFQYGGSGADGISFFLTDGAEELTAVGAAGGSLGYSNNGTVQGVPNGLIGVGFDAYGNFNHEHNNGPCDTPVEWTGTLTPQSVAVRGPGGLENGYCLLGQAVAPSGGIDVKAVDGGTRANSVRHVRIVIDPPANDAKVSVFLSPIGDASGSMTKVIAVDEPDIFQSTPTFKFGWSASTGNSTDFHEINTLTVASVNVLPPSMSVSTSDPMAVLTNEDAAVTFSAQTNAAEGPIVAGAVVTQTLSLPSGAAFGSLPTNVGGWVLQSGTTSTAAVYSYTPTSAVLPGSALPDLTVPVKSAIAGTFLATSILAGGGIDVVANPVSTRTAASTVTVVPVAASASATTDPASASPAAATFTVPTPSGGAGAVFSLTTIPSATKGTASIDSSTGEITYTPKPNVSGISTFSYRVTTNGEQSAPATVTVTTPPRAADQSATTDFGVPAVVDLGDGASGSGLSFHIAGTPPVSAGTASLLNGELTFTPAVGFSGSTTMTYHVQDTDGLVSTTRTVTIEVRPQAGADTLVLSLDADGHGEQASSLPPVDGGSGPFSYEIVTAPLSGTLAIDPDGSYTYTAADDTTGSFVAAYRAVDADGLPSPAATLTIEVRPYAPPLSGSTPSGSAVTLAAPDTAGASNGTFAVIQPASGGSATIDPSSGAITFTPTSGTSGIVSLGYTVTANGETSTPTTVTITVVPVVVDHSATTPAATATTVDLTAGAHGTGLTYSVVSDAGSRATLTGDIADGTMIITPVAGFSGPLTISYRATDVGTLSSTAKTVIVTVLPAAAPSGATVALPIVGTAPQTFPLPAPTGTGPFSYRVVPGSFDPADGDLVIDPRSGIVTFTPVAGDSGIFPGQYTVTDGSGNVSPAQSITLTVRPGAEKVMISVPIGSRSIPLPTPVSAGTVPLVFALASQPDPTIGTATIDSTTGVVSFVPTSPNASGKVTFSYSVTDASGIVSDPAAVEVDVRPATEDVSASGDGALIDPDGIVVIPEARGTGPFTYRGAGSSQHVTVIATATGFVATPDSAFTGTATFRFMVVDASGVASDTQLATLAIGGLAMTGSTGTGVTLLTGGGVLAVGLLLLGIYLIRRRRAERA